MLRKLCPTVYNKQTGKAEFLDNYIADEYMKAKRMDILAFKEIVGSDEGVEEYIENKKIKHDRIKPIRSFW